MADLHIGLTAYLVVGNLVFVKVPSERGRYMLTDMCVVAVPCPLCEAIVGEPCRSYYGLKYWDRIAPTKKPDAHSIGTHAARRVAAKAKFGKHYAQRVREFYRCRVASGDIEQALKLIPEPVPAEVAPDIDVPVTRKADEHQ